MRKMSFGGDKEITLCCTEIQNTFYYHLLPTDADIHPHLIEGLCTQSSVHVFKITDTCYYLPLDSEAAGWKCLRFSHPAPPRWLRIKGAWGRNVRFPKATPVQLPTRLLSHLLEAPSLPVRKHHSAEFFRPIVLHMNPGSHSCRFLGGDVWTFTALFQYILIGHIYHYNRAPEKWRNAWQVFAIPKLEGTACITFM